MPNPNEEEQGEFKVVDRRLFTHEGERRAEATLDPPKPAPEAPPPKARTPEPPRNQGNSQPADTETRSAQREGQFEQLVMSLLTTAMFQMGLAARPGEPPPPPDLAATQETIDLLTMLQEKTKGNLTKEEEEVLTGGLYEIRMAFVELTRRMGRPIRPIR